jgi:hypothetical protein
MSSAGPPNPSSYPPGTVPSTAPSYAGATSTPPPASEIKLISHSTLFYWWPVWLLAFVLAFWTYIENDRLAIVPASGAVTKVEDEKRPGTYEFRFVDKSGQAVNADVLHDALELSKSPSGNEPFPTRVSRHPAMGVIFVVALILTIIVTNVPLRGLWSFIVLMTIALIVVIISLVPGAWDRIFTAIVALRVHINLAGYLFIGTAVFALWAVATFVFDRRAFVIFTPGQIKVCEHIGAAVETYPTLGVGLTKQRDDLFRHYIFGFGSGDLILKFSTGDRREIRIPNVLGIGWQLKAVEDMLRTLPSTR